VNSIRAIIYRKSTSLNEFGTRLKHQYKDEPVDMGGYILHPHSMRIFSCLKTEYSSPEDIDFLKDLTAASRKIDVVKLEHGYFVRAASIESDEIAEYTNYDSIWIRDSSWSYLALNSDSASKMDAQEVLLTQLDFLCSQRNRLIDAIRDPSLLDGEAGHMNACHVRFDGSSSEFKDVTVDGESQFWMHKQNDALGLLLGVLVDAIRDGSLSTNKLKVNRRMDAIVLLVAYLNAIKFFDMEDSGSWEENVRLNTSSIGLVTSALEQLLSLLNNSIVFRDYFNNSAYELKISELTSEKEINKLIDKGYWIMREQISMGGESPNYADGDSRKRFADAALLNLIYPAKLSRLSTEEKIAILGIVEGLVGEYGIRRYWGDNYQSANFWFNEIKTDASPESHKKREEMFIECSEAQWFFDSWFAKCSLILARETADLSLKMLAYKHTNRALAQITSDERSLGANGKEVSAFSLPESYNMVIIDDNKYYLPSPICPLNWSKAMLTLLFEEYKMEDCNE
jgi:hypothetical protein